MHGSKIRLSPPEAALFGNAEMILTKNSVLQKTAALLGEVQNVLQDEAPSFIRTLSPPPKISRGENYLGLPYVILDYPRIAKGDDLLFIRSLFWWGNFYSSTLQLSGAFKQKHRAGPKNAYEILAGNTYFIGIHQDPWVHHFEADNYKAIQGLSKEAFALLVDEIPHTKIAARWPLQEWDAAAMNLIKSWKLLMALL